MFLTMLTLGIGVFPQESNAVYRSISTSQFSRFRQDHSRNTSRGYRGVRTRTLATKKGSFASDTERRSVRIATGRRKSFSRKIISKKNTVLTHPFSANDVESFAIKLPRDFKKTADTLTWTGGEISFANTNSTVNIIALGNVCEGGTVFVQDCLDKVSDKRTDALEEEWKSGIILDKKITQLRWTGEYRFDQENAGKWFLLDVGDKKIGVLTFFDPIRKYLWRLEVISSDSSTGILNESQAIDKMKESLFMSEEVTTPSNRILQRAQGERSSRLRSNSRGRRISIEKFSSKDVHMYKAKQVPFEIEIPRGFTVSSDTLTRSSGKLSFEGKEGTIIVTAVDSICVSQTSSITRKCIEQFGAKEITALKESHKTMSNLGTKNYRLQLTKAYSTRSIGRGAMLMSGADRVAIFVFAEPEYGYMWKIDIVSNVGQRGVLGDTRQLRKLLTSLRFEKE